MPRVDFKNKVTLIITFIAMLFITMIFLVSLLYTYNLTVDDESYQNCYETTFRARCSGVYYESDDKKYDLYVPAIIYNSTDDIICLDCYVGMSNDTIDLLHIDLGINFHVYNDCSTHEKEYYVKDQSITYDSVDDSKEKLVGYIAIVVFGSLSILFVIIISLLLCLLNALSKAKEQEHTQVAEEDEA